jgi:hypothetical protein
VDVCGTPATGTVEDAVRSGVRTYAARDGRRSARGVAAGGRAKRVGKYQIRPLSQDEGQRFGLAWRRLQSRFIDDPSGAVREADTVVTELMTLRGYPMTEFDRRAEDLSVDHPAVVDHYRQAHAIALRDASDEASTEDLRHAVVYYRALFEELLDVREPERKRA